MTVPIFNYESQYSISESGVIINIKTGGIKAHVFDSHSGYYKTQLWRENKMKCFFVHLLIARHFIPNPENHKYLNHEDGDKLNNKIINLKWCTQSYNCLHGIHVLGKRKFEKAYNFKGVIHKEYGAIFTTREAEFVSGINRRTLTRMLNGEIKNSSQFIWTNNARINQNTCRTGLHVWDG